MEAPVSVINKWSTTRTTQYDKLRITANAVRPKFMCQCGDVAPKEQQRRQRQRLQPLMVRWIALVRQ